MHGISMRQSCDRKAGSCSVTSTFLPSVSTFVSVCASIFGRPSHHTSVDARDRSAIRQLDAAVTARAIDSVVPGSKDEQASRSNAAAVPGDPTWKLGRQVAWVRKKHRCSRRLRTLDKTSDAAEACGYCRNMARSSPHAEHRWGKLRRGCITTASPSGQPSQCGKQIGPTHEGMGLASCGRKDLAAAAFLEQVALMI